MKSFNQIAAAMYAAYCKQAQRIDAEGLAGHAPTWDELDAGTQGCWIAAAQQAAAELALVH
jgi:hypothetical protein